MQILVIKELSHGDIMNSMVTIVNTIYIAYVKVAKRINLKSYHHKLDFCGDYFAIYTNIKTLCCTPKTSICQLYFNKYCFAKQLPL